MPFSAEVRRSGGAWEPVDITTMDAPKIDLLGCELRCPDADCHAPLIVRHTINVAAHFAHKPDSATPGCVFAASGGESEDHREAKRTLIAKLRASSIYAAATVEPERILRHGGVKRVADVCVTWPGGGLEVHEVQLSRITVQEAQARTNDYMLMGVDNVIWWFGRANSGDSNLEQWAYRSGGIVGQVDFHTERVIAIA